MSNPAGRKVVTVVEISRKETEQAGAPQRPARPQHRPAANTGRVISPLSWGVARRVAWTGLGCAFLWLAVLWALS